MNAIKTLTQYDIELMRKVIANWKGYASWKELMKAQARGEITEAQIMDRSYRPGEKKYFI